MNIQQKINILFTRTGTCQADRLLPELVKNDLLINDKELSDHLRFLYLYTDLIAYYDSNNERIDGNIWRKFLEQDDTVIRSLILHTNIDGAKKDIHKNLLALRHNAANLASHKHITSILNIAQDLIILLNYWRKNLSNEDIVRAKLDAVVHEELNGHMKRMYNVLYHSGKTHNREAFIDFCNFLAQQDQHALWELHLDSYSDLHETNPNNTQIIDTIDDFFDAVFHTIYQLKELASSNYADTLQLQNKEPHIALLIAFLKLLQYADVHLNDIPQRSLAHYYRHILKFNNNPAIPDQAYVHFSLHTPHDFAFVPAGSRLIAKNSLNDEPIFFETANNITINKAKIKQINILFPTQKSTTAGYKTVELIAVSQPMESLSKEQLFPILPTNLSTIQQPTQQLAMLVGSPLFYLAEGTRIIHLKWKLTCESFQELLHRNPNPEQDTEAFMAQLDTMFNTMAYIQITTQLGWFRVSEKAITLKCIQATCCLHMTITLNPEVPAMDRLPSDFQETIVNPAIPALSIGIRDRISFIGRYLSNGLVVERLDLKVNVEHYRGLILQNQLGPIDNSQVIEPFGPLPKLDSCFYIGSGEIFSKNLTALKIDIKWDNISILEGGLRKYYSAYPTQVNNEDFKVNISYLNYQHWNPSCAQNRQHVPLFQTEKGSKEGEQLDHNRCIANIDIAALNITKANCPLEIFMYGPKTTAGFLKLQLSGPEQAFGHAIYPSLLNGVLIHNAQQKKSEKELVLNEPYTPRIKSITVDYEAKESIVLTSPPGEEEAKYLNSFFHISSFGYTKVFPGKMVTPTTFLPLVEDKESFITFGIEDLNSHSLSMYMAIGENKLDTDQEIQPPKWFYLSDNCWLPMKEAIIVDTTNGCTQSGIIVFDFKELTVPPTRDNTYMKAGLIWIKAQFMGNLDTLTPILGVYLQAVKVSRIMDSNGVFSPPILPAGSITQLQYPIDGIDGVTQPCSTSNGRKFENHQAFYRRVSERLRHKNRAISVWDYEHIILEKFPEIHRVKCLNHTQKNTYSMLRPGHITLVVIAKRALNATGIFPRVSRKLLTEIKTYIQSIATPFVQCEVINPTYEDIKVHVTVKLKSGYEQGLFLNYLQTDLQSFLSPWLFDDSADILLGGDIPTAKVIDFINSRSYIEGIGNFSIFKYVDRGENLKLDKVTSYDSCLRASNPWSIMISAKTHKVSCVDTFESAIHLRHGSVGDMAVGEDFIIGPFEPAPIAQAAGCADEDIRIPSPEEHCLVIQKYIKTAHDHYK